MEKFEINKSISYFEKKINEFKNKLDINNLNNLSKEYQKIMNEPNFWNDQNRAKEYSKKLSDVKEKLNDISNIENKYNDILTLLEMYDEENDEDILKELENNINSFNQELDEMSIKVLLNGKYDKYDCILELHPGAGGTESMDWASMLYRMYLRYCQRKNYKVEVLNYLPGEEAGIKSVTILIKGEYAYGYLKSEIGVHRLVRISPFDSNSRRHTSFCSCMVYPNVSDDLDIDLKDEDLKIDVYRSSGAGGQSVNTTDSAVRITHIPTGIVVTCQNERSQIKNRETALSILKSKLIQLEIEKKENELDKLRGDKSNINFGSQIRSYVFAPYTLVKDHRTNFENGNINDVMDGNIDDFIVHYLINRGN